MTEDIYQLNDQIGYKLRLAHQRHVELFSRMMPELTPTQFAVLARLREVGPISQNHLGRLVAMDGATVKGVVDRLNKRGLLAVRQNPSDLRRREISLTKEGNMAAAAAIATAHEISRATTAKLTARERDHLLRLLDKL